jgi:hypothetical protein
MSSPVRARTTAGSHIHQEIARERSRALAQARLAARPAPHMNMEVMIEVFQPAESRRRAQVAARAVRPDPASVTAGWRRPRRSPLTHADLWRGGVGPQDQSHSHDNDHHMCGICHFVKSHPVSCVRFVGAVNVKAHLNFRYTCGHSHCFVCIRIWLEKEWTCPECVTVMGQPPFRHYAEEAGIAREYPDWKDASSVDFSFEDLIFPTDGEGVSGAASEF